MAHSRDFAHSQRPGRTTEAQPETPAAPELSAEHELARRLRRQAHDDVALVMWMRALPREARLTAEIVAHRELGTARAQRLCRSAFGESLLLARANAGLADGDEGTRALPDDAVARYDRARALRLFLAVTDRDGFTPSRSALASLFARVEPSTGAALVALLQGTQRPAGGSLLHYLDAHSGGAVSRWGARTLGLRAELRRSFGDGADEVEIEVAATAGDVAGAEAVTHHRRVLVAPGQFDPASDEGRLRIGHEVAHALQQRGSGPVGRRDALEVEAEQAGRALVAGARYEVRGHAASGTRLYRGEGQDPEASSLEETLDLLVHDHQDLLPLLQDKPQVREAHLPPAAHAQEPELSGGTQQMTRLLAVARARAAGRKPRGKCYQHVKQYILAAGGYGNIKNIYTDRRFGSQGYARNFAETVERLGPATFGLRRLAVATPFDAPPGAIIVVKPGTPGTRHRTAGDITVKGQGDVFYNDGEMRYHGRAAWSKPHGGGILGVYVPATAKDGPAPTTKPPAIGQHSPATTHATSDPLNADHRHDPEEQHEPDKHLKPERHDPEALEAGDRFQVRRKQIQRVLSSEAALKSRIAQALRVQSKSNAELSRLGSGRNSSSRARSQNRLRELRLRDQAAHANRELEQLKRELKATQREKETARKLHPRDFGEIELKFFDHELSKHGGQDLWKAGGLKGPGFEARASGTVKLGSDGLSANAGASADASAVKIEKRFDLDIGTFEVHGERLSGTLFLVLQGSVGIEAQAQIEANLGKMAPTHSLKPDWNHVFAGTQLAKRIDETGDGRVNAAGGGASVSAFVGAQASIGAGAALAWHKKADSDYAPKLRKAADTLLTMLAVVNRPLAWALEKMGSEKLIQRVLDWLFRWTEQKSAVVPILGVEAIVQGSVGAGVDLVARAGLSNGKLEALVSAHGTWGLGFGGKVRLLIDVGNGVKFALIVLEELVEPAKEFLRQTALDKLGKEALDFASGIWSDLGSWLEDDDKARELVQHDVHKALAPRDRARLVTRMLDLVVGSESEAAILKVLRDSEAQGDVSEVLKHLDRSQLLRRVYGQEDDELRAIFARHPVI